MNLRRTARIIVNAFKQVYRKGRFSRKAETLIYQRRMRKIALPLVDALASHLPASHRKELAEQAVKATEAEKKSKELIEEIWDRLFLSRTLAYVQGNKIRVLPKTRTETYAHELVHFIARKGVVKNDLVGANAVGRYFRDCYNFKKFREDHPNQRSTMEPLDDKLITREKSWYDNFAPRFAERKHAGIGRMLGTYAAWLEDSIKTPGAGLFFIKHVLEGENVRETERKIRAGMHPEIELWARQHASNFAKIIEKMGEQK